MTDAEDVVDAFYRETRVTDEAMAYLLAEFIEVHGLAPELERFLETKRSDHT